jgi:hypothetical protein
MARSSPSRRWPAAIAAFVVAAGVGAGIGAFLGSREQVATDLRLRGGTTVTEAPSTTVPLEVPTTVPSDTTVAPDTTAAPTTAAPRPTAPARPDPIELGASGSQVSPPPNEDRRLVSNPDDCAAFTATGVASACGRFNSRSVAVVWVRDAEGSFDVLTRDESADGGDVWVVRLAGDASAMADDPRVADVTGDGEADLIVGARDGDDLAIDVIEVSDGSPRVTLHLDLPGGRARVSSGELLVWAPVGDGRLAQYSLTAGSGAWGVASSEFVAAGSVAPSQF